MKYLKLYFLFYSVKAPFIDLSKYFKMAQIDLINRDPHTINKYIEVEYDDVFGEPDGIHSADW